MDLTSGTSTTCFGWLVHHDLIEVGGEYPFEEIRLTPAAAADSAAAPAPLTCPQRRFNAAGYFIDRHLDEGRGGAVAIECGDRRITYQQLHDRGQPRRDGAQGVWASARSSGCCC